MMKTKMPILAALATVAAIGVSGCGSSSSDAAAQTHPSMSPSMKSSGTSTSMSPSKPTEMGNMLMVSIQDFMYMGPMTAKPGEMVMVTNNDSETHTLTSDQSGLFTVSIQPGGTATFAAPDKSGTYSYHCNFHSNMHGTLVVK